MTLKFPIRLQSFLAKGTVLSRRKAEEAIRDGRVELNGKTVTEMGVMVNAADKVSLDGEKVSLHLRSVVYMLNKPRGSVCTDSDPHEVHYARDFIDTRDHDMLFSVGRLDKDSEGLILFTNDGDLANRITHPSFGVTKTYTVSVTDRVAVADLLAMKKGVRFDDSPEPYKIDSFTVLFPSVVEVVLSSGKNREIRRLFEHFGYQVERLVRVKIGALELGELTQRHYRKLKAEDIDLIFQK